MVKNVPGKLSDTDFKSVSWQACGLLLVSAATLCFEINLTRLFSVGQFYHFAFMVVSIALLGFGASGTFLALRTVRPEKAEERIFPWLAVGSGVSMLGSYLLVNQLPFDSFRMAVDPKQIAILLFHYAALASPFFFSGMIISMMLRKYQTSGGDVYAVNLLGSAAGCLMAVLLPVWVQGEGVVALSVAMAALAGLLFTIGDRHKVLKNEKRAGIVPGFFSAAFLVLMIILGIRIQSGGLPGFFELHISPYKSISYALQHPEARIISSEWNSFSKVDVVRSPSLHSMPGLSYRYPGSLPPIDGLFIDGGNLNAILLSDSALELAAFLPASIAFQLRPDGDVLILESKGGMDIQAALTSGADQVTAVEANPLVIEASPVVYNQEGVHLVKSSGRSFLRGTTQRFDIIQLPLTDSYQPVSSGAYTLGEDYRYTVEAVSDMLNRLTPNGLLVITRWLQEDPSEWLRTFSLAVTALEAQGADPLTQIVALRGYNTGTLLVKNGSFQEGELNTVRTFAGDKAFDLVYAPGIEESEINRFNILPEPVYYQTFLNLLETHPREKFYATYPYAVDPPTDDHPFFGHYFKWSQMDEILGSLGYTWQPFGGAGYLVILVIFFLALVLSGVLILLPVVVMKRTGAQLQRKRVPIYFGLIGLAFLLVEIPLIQRFILYLDQPAYAFAAVLFGILLFSGLGSRFGSRKLPLQTALISLVGVLLVYHFLLPPLLHRSLGFPLVTRLLLTILLIAPMGFLMGIPLPGGLAWMRASVDKEQNHSARWMIAWIWAVNGAFSVVASILAALLALSFGFGVTSAVGTGCYLLAWVMARK